MDETNSWQPSRAQAVLAGLALLALALGFGWVGALNYDGMYALAWGQDVADLRRPDFTASLAPTPKPLAIGLGAVAASVGLGHAAEPAMVGVGILSLAGIAAACGTVAGHLAGRSAGLLAAGLVVTREPVVSWAFRGYLDVLFAALVLASVSFVLRRRHGTSLGLLAIAGLIRPEAWALAALCLALDWRGRSPVRRGIGVAAVVVAPAVWCGLDLIVTGDPFWSLTGTRGTAVELGRPSGLDAVVLVAPRRLGEIMREPVLVAAALGVVVVTKRRGPSEMRTLGALAVLVVLFGVLAVAGLPVIARYLLPIAALCGVIAAIGVVVAVREDRRRWRVVGWIAVAALAFSVPFQVDRLRDTGRVLGKQRAVSEDLHRLADRGDLGSCRPIAVTTHRPVPVLELWLEIERGAMRIADEHALGRGTVLWPKAVARRLFVLDPNDPARGARPLDPSFRRRAESAFWAVYERC